ncbi:glycosyltransferase family 2 protein [Winogradskyella psychrotolerans]|uniref:glycosyltransferase family 2 protein n=1 Tax=Winogradskyella psychrotolerans TaxID=1344585 RepID=UPI000593DAED|nr:glycosyltransferase family 2 protein [Winogradskyella psychrotolerans]
MQSNLQATIIVSTFNKPEWLQLVLLSFDLQTTKNFEIIVADDGSDEKTKAVVDQFSKRTDLKVIHVWQEDDGFQKTKILNKAIVASNADYLIFTDGDCIARKDFVETHLKLSQLKHALSGGYFKLSNDVSIKINDQVVRNQHCFEKDWLIAEGQPKTFKMNKLTKSKTKASFLNSVTPTKATFDGMNVSCWKSDILAVNGFDERMKYGGEDREVGERMMHNGVRFLQIRYSAICVHLHHERPYKNEEALILNKQVRQHTKREKSTYTQYGIKKD